MNFCLTFRTKVLLKQNRNPFMGKKVLRKKSFSTICFRSFKISFGLPYASSKQKNPYNTEPFQIVFKSFWMTTRLQNHYATASLNLAFRSSHMRLSLSLVSCCGEYESFFSLSHVFTSSNLRVAMNRRRMLAFQDGKHST